MGNSFEDLDDALEGAGVTRMTQQEIRDRTHIANGGNASSPVDCVKCGGSGLWRGMRKCFTCDGTGTISTRKAGAYKAMATKQSNAANWRAEHKAEIDFINAEVAYSDRTGKNATFYRNLLEGIQSYGKLTDNQLTAVRNAIAKKAEFFAQRRAAQPTVSGSIGVERINALFAAAFKSGLGIKKGIAFRTEFLDIKPARKDSSILYVTDKRMTDPLKGGAQYVGKIVDGKFEARREAKPDTLGLLCEIASNPMEIAAKYGKASGICSCCGAELTNELSKQLGIGPICREKWGI